jgi:hypothetical protein
MAINACDCSGGSKDLALRLFGQRRTGSLWLLGGLSVLIVTPALAQMPSTLGAQIPEIGAQDIFHVIFDARTN